VFSKLTCQKSGSKPGCWLTLEAKCIFESTWCLLPSLKSRGAHLRHLFYFSSGTSLPVTCHNQNYCSFPLWWTRKPFANLRSLEVIPDNLSVNCLGMNLSRRSRLQGYTYFVQDIHCIRIRQVTVLSTGSRSPSPTRVSPTVPLFLQTSNLPTCSSTWATSHVPSSLFPQTLDQPALQQLPLWTFSVRGRRRN